MKTELGYGNPFGRGSIIDNEEVETVGVLCAAVAKINNSPPFKKVIEWTEDMLSELYHYVHLSEEKKKQAKKIYSDWINLVNLDFNRDIKDKGTYRGIKFEYIYNIQNEGAFPTIISSHRPFPENAVKAASNKKVKIGNFTLLTEEDAEKLISKYN